jgi:hypothetical protein
LTDGLLKKFQTSPHSTELRKVPTYELRNRSNEIIRNLSGWLFSKSDAEVARRFREIGGCGLRRASRSRMFAGASC